MEGRARNAALALTPILLLLMGWEALARTGNINILLSSPSAIASALYSLLVRQTPSGYPVLLYHTAYSLYALGLSFAIALTVGVLLGAIAGTRRALYQLIDPIVTFIMPIPGIAWAPLFLIWFGFGIRSVIAVAALVTFFPIFYNTATGVRGVDDKLIRAARIMGVSDRGVLTKILLPGAAAYIFTGIKLGFAKGWRTIIAVEMIASSLWGLGYMIFDARDYLQPDVIYGGIVVLIIVYYSMEHLVLQQIEKRTVLRWGMTREGA